MPDTATAEAIFQEAADLPAAERRAFVERACGGNPALQREVESLLRFLDADEQSLLGRVRAPVGSRAVPERVGRYRIVRVIGEGGMGVVYEAVQEHPRRTVALKVLRWALASPGLIRRFEHEAEVLGQLAHPGIAQVYEAGSVETDFGRQPFFAMELVSGRPLTDYAASAGLSVPERLELLARVCDAVHHAHQKGVIHRDLKPANILVTQEGQPKILDFGIARATDSDMQTVTRTEVGALLGTLPYMSPEQVSGEPGGIDTRSDVYSLGVILYELLAGRLPYELGTSIPEVARIIRETEPRPLTSIDLAFRGDISTIVGKALQKEKERRYQSAAELAADLRHYLHDEPISARAPTAMYQLRKFARRNRALVGGAAATLAALVLGAIAASVLAVRATRNEASARAYANRALVAAAAADLEMRNATAARSRLAAVPTERRGWEWRYLNWLSDQSLATLDTGSGRVIATAAAIAGPDGQRRERVMLHLEGRLWIWNPLTGAVEAEAQTGFGRAWPYASPDGRTIVCLDLEGEPGQQPGAGMAGYDALTLNERWRTDDPAMMGPEIFVPESQPSQFMAVVRGRLSFRETDTGREVRSVPFQDPSLWRVCPLTAHQVVAHTAELSAVFDLDQEGSRLSLPIINPVPILGGRQIVGTNGSSLLIVDAGSGREVRRLAKALRFDPKVAASEDGRWAAASEAKGSIVLWDLREGHPVAALHGHEAAPSMLAFAPSGDWLVSADRAGVVKVWDAVQMPSPFAPGIGTDGAGRAAVSPDGSCTATCGWGSARVWDVRRGIPRWTRVLWRNREGIWPACEFAPDGRVLLVSGWSREATLFDAATGALLWRVAGSNQRPCGAAWAAAGDAVAIVGYDGALETRARADGSLLAQRAGPAPITAMAGHAASGRLACAGGGTVRFWSIGGLAPGMEWPVGPDPVGAMTISPDGGLLATADDRRIVRIDDARTGRRLAEGAVGTAVAALAFSPDGSRLVAAGRDGSVRILETATAAEVLMLDVPEGIGLSAVLFPNDSLVMAGSRMGCIAFDLAPAPAVNRARRLSADATEVFSGVVRQSMLVAPTIERLRTMDGLDEELRAASIELARGWGDQLNYLNSTNWGESRFAGNTPEAYAASLLRAEAVCAQWPGERSFINTLGVARYRAGRYAAAVEALLESDRLGRAGGGATAAEDAAFLAMTYHHLGNHVEAERWLAAAEKAVAPNEPPNSELAIFLAEARATVHGDG